MTACVVDTTKHAFRLAAVWAHLTGTYHLSARSARFTGWQSWLKSRRF